MVLKLVLLLAVWVAAQDPCLDVSWAVPAVHDLVQYPLGTATTPQQGINFVWNVAQGVTSQYYLALFFGLQNGDFFMLRNCHIVESTTTSYCGVANTPFVAFVRHSSYGDNYRRILPVGPTGLLGAVIATETNMYNTTGRPWYVQQNGWSPTYNLASSTGIAQAFSTAFPGGVVAADRTFREPCNVCLMNSYAVPAVTALAQTNLRDFSGVTSFAAIPPLMARMLSYMQAGNRGYSISIFIGLPNSDYYEVLDCANPENAGPYCTAAAPSRYVAGIRNDVVAPAGITGMVVPYALSDAGVMATTPTSTSVAYTYNPVTRPYYIQGQGWTPSYVFVNSAGGPNIIGRSFTSAGYDPATNAVVAVVGADSFTSEPCVGYVTPACPGSS